jgi:8-oxo-dGTP pyrophosphatase MutT (NUDIX family)
MRILDERVLHEQTWTLLKEKSYLDTEGKRGCWTYIERRQQRKAAVIVATTERSGRLLVIEQFRIPFEAEIYEFPAGLIDKGETPEQTARRELVEETGFQGDVLEVGPGVSTTAGLSTEIVHMVYMRVGEEPAAKPRLEASERIRVLTIRPEEFESFLSECERHRRILDAKLYLYLKDRPPRRKET